MWRARSRRRRGEGEDAMAQFMLLIRGGDREPSRETSPEEFQQLLAKYRAWAGGLAEQGRMRGGQKLKDDGSRILRQEAGGEVVCDGPFTETKETIGGYFLIEAADYAEAAAM